MFQNIIAETILKLCLVAFVHYAINKSIKSCEVCNFSLIQNHVNHNCVNCAHFREQTESVGFLRNLYQTLSQLISQQVDTLEIEWFLRHVLPSPR